MHLGLFLPQAARLHLMAGALLTMADGVWDVAPGPKSSK